MNSRYSKYYDLLSVLRARYNSNTITENMLSEREYWWRVSINNLFCHLIIDICFVRYALSLSLQLGLTITIFHSFQELYCIGTTIRWKLWPPSPWNCSINQSAILITSHL